MNLNTSQMKAQGSSFESSAKMSVENIDKTKAEEKFKAEVQKIDIKGMMSEGENSKYTHSLNNKIKAGLVLSDDEMDHLEKKSPELYKEALELVKEREAYLNSIGSKKDKQDVVAVKSETISKISNEVKATLKDEKMSKSEKLQKVEKSGKEFANIMNEHSSYTSTDKYKKLPDSDKIALDKASKQLQIDEDNVRTQIRESETTLGAKKLMDVTV